MLRFRGMILTPDGRSASRPQRSGPARRQRMRLGEDAAAELLDRAGPDFLRALA